MARKTEQTGLRTVITLLFLLCLLPNRLQAQAEELEYKMDLGAAIGTCFYLGDANSTPYAHMSIMGGLMARRILNPRMAVKMNIAMGGTSILIVVSVALETARTMESQMMMRHHSGFLK